MWEASQDVRILKGFENPHWNPHRICESSQDLRVLTGFKNPHRIWESSQDLRILTGVEWRIQTGFENPFSTVFWYLKI
jgi:hypothetical protein